MTVLAPPLVKILAVCDEVDGRLYATHDGQRAQTRPT